MEFKYEIPWCEQCAIWHDPKMGHVRAPYVNSSSANSGTWHRQERREPPRFTRDEGRTPAALRTLGVKDDATIGQVRRAFRELIVKEHPDHGGDEAKAKKIVGAYNHLKKVGRA